VLKPGGVIGVVDGASTVTFRYPTNPLLEAFDTLRGLEREYNTGRPSDTLQLRVLLREAGFARTGIGHAGHGSGTARRLS
jgi:hypothetical protein